MVQEADWNDREILRDFSVNGSIPALKAGGIGSTPVGQIEN